VVNAMMDGPVDFSIDGDRVTLSGTSAGERLTFTLRLEHALISRHRFNAAYDDAMARPYDENVVSFPLPRAHAADSA
jgi:hypothetical protein